MDYFKHCFPLRSSFICDFDLTSSHVLYLNFLLPVLYKGEQFIKTPLNIWMYDYN